MSEQEFLKEAEKIRERYAAFDAGNNLKDNWAPFNTKEALHRLAQQFVFTQAMQKAGRVDLEGMRILDVGCGRGRVLRACLDMGAKASDLAGVDLHEPYVREARALSPGIQYGVSGGVKLNFPDAHFDLVTQYVVFSSVPVEKMRLELAREMLRVLKPGGFIFWWDLVRSGGIEGSLDPAGHFPGMKILYQGRTSPSAVKDLLLGSLFKIILNAIFGRSSTHMGALLGPKP